jgi:hypothetical protein
VKISSLSAVAGFALFIPVAALAQSAPASAPAPAPSVSTATPDGQVICKYYYYNGRVLPHPECRTAHEWERDRFETQKNVREFQIRSLTHN